MLNPGNADAHRMAALAAQNAEHYDLAWDQAIRAYLAGANPQTVFGGLSAESPAAPGLRGAGQPSGRSTWRESIPAS